MTRRRNDTHSTEFGLWLREQKAIASNLGYVATNLDYIWSNYKTGEWMLIEEKRYNAEMTFAQKQQFKQLDDVCQICNDYNGFYLIVFENTSPSDGLITINHEAVTECELLEFLRFDLKINSYFSELLVSN